MKATSVESTRDPSFSNEKCGALSGHRDPGLAAASNVHGDTMGTGRSSPTRRSKRIRTLASIVLLGGLFSFELAQAEPGASPLAEGISPILSQDSELWGNPYGGERQELVYTGLLAFGVEVDLERAGVSRGTSVGALGLWIQGDNLSTLAVLDAGIVSNIAGVPTVRLFKWWFRQKWLDGRIDLKVGQLPIDDDFLYLDSAQLFINSGFGTAQTLALNVPAPIYPLGTLGTRLALLPTDQLEFLFGIYDADAGSPRRSPRVSDLNLTVGQGAMLLAEISYRPEVGGRSTRLTLGGFHHAGNVSDFGEELSSARIDTDFDATGRGLDSLYVMTEHALWENQGKSIIAFSHGALTFPSAHAVATAYFDLGVVMRGGWWSRPADRLGVGYAWTRFGDEYLGAQQLRGRNRTGTEGVAELTYLLRIAGQLSLQPSLQWIFDPHFSQRDSLAAALRLSVSL